MLMIVMDSYIAIKNIIEKTLRSEIEMIVIERIEQSGQKMKGLNPQD